MRLVPFLALALLLAGCATVPRPIHLSPLPALVRADPAAAGFAPELNARLDSIVSVAMAQGAAPGVALAVGRYGRLVHLKAYGHIDNTADSPPVTDSTMFDMASLTKVVATTTALMMLEDEGKLNLDSTVSSYIPELTDSTKAKI